MFATVLTTPCSSGRGGDPVVLLGAAGGGGGHGRAQVNHKILEDTLSGFFCVILIDEYNTSRCTTCCHKPAHAPRSKFRSRGCTHCGKLVDPDGAQDGRRHVMWWDRDTGAGW